MKQQLAVKSKSFSLYESFKNEAENIGWIYNESFTPFVKEKTDSHDCLFFCYEFNNKHTGPQFSFSNSGSSVDILRLETDFSKAIDTIKEMFSQYVAPVKPIIDITIDEIAKWKDTTPDKIRIKL